MKTINLLRCLFFIVIAIVAASHCFAQNTITTVNDSTGLHSYSAFKGDTLLIAYDSAFIMNKFTHKLYRDNYLRVQNKDASTKSLITNYENLIQLQDSMLKAKEVYYQQLKTNFDSLVTTSTTFADRTDANVTAINTSLATVTQQLNHVNALLDDSLEKLKKQNQQKLKVALGGFAVGVGITGLIFLVAN